MAVVSMLLKSHFNFVVFYYFPQFHDVALVSEQLSDPSFHLDNPADGDWVWCLPLCPPSQQSKQAGRPYQAHQKVRWALRLAG